MSAAFDHAVALDPGQGHVDLFGYASLERAGVGLALESKLSPSLTAFAQARAGMERGQSWRPDASVVAGVRWQW